MSVGVGATKLTARLAGPANKPDAITVVPYARLRDFWAGIRIQVRVAVHAVRAPA